MAVTKKQRFEIFKRDQFTCQYCGNRPPDVVLECDHINPRCEGGTDDYSNLITSCFNCNRGKAGNSIHDGDCDRVQQMQLEQVAQQAAFNAMLMDAEQTRKNQHRWLVEKVIDVLNWEEFSNAQQSSIALFARKLPIDSIVEAAEITASKKMASGREWRYFCGVCWGRIKDAERITN